VVKREDEVTEAGNSPVLGSMPAGGAVIWHAWLPRGFEETLRVIAQSCSISYQTDVKPVARETGWGVLVHQKGRCCHRRGIQKLGDH
jgi:hypothetical protein